MKICKLILLNLSILLFGCGKDSGMRISTNTFANQDVIPKGFPLGTSFSVETKQQGELLFSKEVSQKIATILQNKGFMVKSPAYANYHLNFSFGMEKSTHTRDVPVVIPDYGRWYYHDWPYHYGYGYGYHIAYIPEEYTLFNKILLIEVFKNNEKVPVWQGTTHSYETDSDLRDAIDYLLVTVFKHFGYNTKRYVKSKMEENDPQVTNLRQGY